MRVIRTVLASRRDHLRHRDAQRGRLLADARKVRALGPEQGGKTPASARMARLGHESQASRPERADHFDHEESACQCQAAGASATRPCADGNARPSTDRSSFRRGTTPHSRSSTSVSVYPKKIRIVYLSYLA